MDNHRFFCPDCRAGFTEKRALAVHTKEMRCQHLRQNRRDEALLARVADAEFLAELKAKTHEELCVVFLELKRGHDSKLLELKTDHDSKLLELKTDHDSKLLELKTDHAEIKKYLNELDGWRGRQYYRLNQLYNDHVGLKKDHNHYRELVERLLHGGGTMLGQGDGPKQSGGGATASGGPVAPSTVNDGDYNKGEDEDEDTPEMLRDLFMNAIDSAIDKVASLHRLQSRARVQRLQAVQQQQEPKYRMAI